MRKKGERDANLCCVGRTYARRDLARDCVDVYIFRICTIEEPTIETNIEAQRGKVGADQCYLSAGCGHTFCGLNGGDQGHICREK